MGAFIKKINQVKFFFTDYTTVSRNEITTVPPKKAIGSGHWIFFAKEKVDIACDPMSGYV
jgi:hypothetical protein